MDLYQMDPNMSMVPPPQPEPPKYVKVDECYEDPNFTIFMYTTDDLLLAASMASTVFNVMVIFCAIKLYKKSGDTMHLFILNMTAGDLVLTIFCHPNELLIRKHSWLKQVHLCAIVSYFNWLGLTVSGLSLTMLNIDKLIYFRWPLSYDSSMSKQRAGIICGLIWALNISFISYGWIAGITYMSDCTLQLDRTRMYYYEIYLVLFCVLPVTSSLIVSIYLFQLTRQKRSATIVNGVQSDMPTFRNKMKSLVFIFATTAWTSFSLLPYRCLNIARIHFFVWRELDCQQQMMMNWVAWSLLYLLTINPIVNPLITALIYAPYRLTIKKFLVNIPVGNRPIYSYRGDNCSDTSFLSVRRSRHLRHSSSIDQELTHLRESRSLNSPRSPIDGVKPANDFKPERPKSSTFPGLPNN